MAVTQESPKPALTAFESWSPASLARWSPAAFPTGDGGTWTWAEPGAQVQPAPGPPPPGPGCPPAASPAGDGGTWPWAEPGARAHGEAGRLVLAVPRFTRS